MRSRIIAVAVMALALGLTRLPWRGIYQVLSGSRGRQDKAVELAWKSCDQGDGSGCFILGYFLAEGYGGDRSVVEVKAVELYRRSCDLGDSMGCNALANAYWDGRGVGRDLAKSLELSRKSCDSVDGYMWACRDLSEAYERGEGTAKDHARSVEYARKTAALHKLDNNKTVKKLTSILESL